MIDASFPLRQSSLDPFCVRYTVFFGNTFLSEGILGQEPKRTQSLTRITIFSYEHVWIAWVGIIYYGKCNYYVLINFIILDIVLVESSFKITLRFSFG